MANQKASVPVWLRRISQIFFLLLFFYLFLATTYRPENEAGDLLTLFFDLDPLVMITVWLGGHAAASALFLSFITLAVTLIFGRWFCGWVCPFGTLHHLFARIKKGKKNDMIQAGRYTVWQKSKYYVLVGLLVSTVFGANLAGWIDPFSFLTRAMATAVFPAINTGFQGIFDWFYNVNPLHLSAASEPIYRVLRKYFLTMGQPHFFWGTLLGVLFGVVIILNFFRGRFWCRYVCPLGGMLGLVGKYTPLRLKIDPDKCTSCMTCTSVCPTAADPQAKGSWRPSECIYCWNCESACPETALSFSFGVPKSDIPKMDLGRRQVITAGVAGLGSCLLLRTHPLAGAENNNPDLIRPPGALAENDFLEKCIRCGECMKICPTNVLQPAMLEAGLEGLWSPVVKMNLGYCEYKCTMCTQICPTEAIKPLRLEEKQKIKIGMAHVDRNRCLPWAFDRSCVVCQEHCPLPEKAIWLEEVTVVNARGTEVAVKRPHVNADLCIGCGICQDKCPVSDQAAIRVTSVGETRNFKNQFRTADRYSG